MIDEMTAERVRCAVTDTFSEAIKVGGLPYAAEVYAYMRMYMDQELGVAFDMYEASLLERALKNHGVDKSRQGDTGTLAVETERAV